MPEESDVSQGKSTDSHTNEEHKMATTTNEIHVQEPTESTSSHNQADKAMDTSSLQIDKPQPTQSTSNDTDVHEASTECETDVSKTHNTSHSISEAKNVDPLKSAPLCMDPKIIEMVKKGLLAVSESKVHELSPSVQLKIRQEVIPKQCNDDTEVVDEIPADGFGDNFQVINNRTSLNTASTSGVSSKVAKEMEFHYDLLQNKFSVRETMKWLTKVDESKVVIQMKQKCAMGVCITTSQIKTIRDNVLHADTLYPEVKFDSSDDDSVMALPQEMYFEKDSQLVVQSKDKEEFYKLAEKIIMKRIDECIIRHFKDK